MRLSKEKMQYPILLGYQVPNRTEWACWCPYCFKWHFHGEVSGHRVAHCDNPHSPLLKTGYYVKPATAKDLQFTSVNNMQAEDYPILKS